MQRVGALLLGVALFLGACSGTSDEDITRLACIKVLRWNHDPGARSEIFDSTLDLYEDAQDGEIAGEQTWENLLQMFTEEDGAALANWESSEPCQEAEREVKEEYGL